MSDSRVDQVELHGRPNRACSTYVCTCRSASLRHVAGSSTPVHTYSTYSSYLLYEAQFKAAGTHPINYKTDSCSPPCPVSTPLLPELLCNAFPTGFSKVQSVRSWNTVADQSGGFIRLEATCLISLLSSLLRMAARIRSHGDCSSTTSLSSPSRERPSLR